MEYQNDTQILYGIIVFYAIVFVFLTAYGYQEFNINFDMTGINETPTTIWGHIGFFFQIVGFGVSGLPWWFNVLLFTPLALIVTFIILRLVRG